MLRTAKPDLYWRHRPFWLLVALAVSLLLSVSATATRAGSVEPGAAGVAALVGGIERNLAALRAQLELVGVDESDPGRSSLREQVALNPGLGDGGRVFRLRAMEAIVRALDRRVDGLIAAQHRAGNDRGLDLARLMSLEARSVHWGIEELRFAREAHLARAARERIGQALDGIARGAAAVSTLHAGLPTAARDGAG